MSTAQISQAQLTTAQHTTAHHSSDQLRSARCCAKTDLELADEDGDGRSVVNVQLEHGAERARLNAPPPHTLRLHMQQLGRRRKRRRTSRGWRMQRRKWRRRSLIV
eukprot:1066416-Rhodomonas_salina.4